MIKNKYLKENLNTNNILLILIIVLPISLLSGSALININVILIDIIFLKIIFFSKDRKVFNDPFINLLGFFYLSLIINIFFNNGDYITWKSQIGILRFFILIYAFKYILNLNDFKNFNLIIKSWLIIFVFVSLDLIFEFTFGFNLVGNSSYIPGRLSGFLGSELKIGNWYAGLVFLMSAYFLYKYKNTKISLLLLTGLLLISFFIGERSNFIKIFIGFSLLLIFTNKISLNLKILTITIFIVCCSLLTLNNTNIKNRFIDQIYFPVKNEGLTNYIMSSHYGVHYYTAYQMFKKNLIFGVGVRQFRYESYKEIYKENKYNIHERDRWATHPHQVHMEFLSETGLFGYLSFLIFILTSITISIKNYLKSKNNYLLASTIFIIISMIPLIPSGSFFTTYSATIFWINFSFMVALNGKKLNFK